MDQFSRLYRFDNIILYYVEKKDFIKHYEPLFFQKSRKNNPDPTGFALPFYLHNIRKTLLPSSVKTLYQQPHGSDWLYLCILDLLKYLKTFIRFFLNCLRRCYFLHILKMLKKFYIYTKTNLQRLIKNYSFKINHFSSKLKTFI
jgi:hypothetical protein